MLSVSRQGIALPGEYKASRQDMGDAKMSKGPSNGPLHEELSELVPTRMGSDDRYQ